jgi:peptidyl-prolyl cis-trans isomerase B (cyclophilin B)
VASVLSVLVVLGGVYALSGLVGGDDKEKVSANAAPTTSASPSSEASTAPKACTYTKQGTAAKKVPLPTFDAAQAAQPYTATVKTNRGDLTMSMLTDKAPCATYSFRWLAEKNFFDKTSCHRLTTSASLKVLQCGDPTGTGTGGPGYSFPDENLAGATYKAGTLAMANSGPDTNGSQFFIVYADSQLPPSYIPFGKVTAGLDVVTKVAKAGSDNSNGQGDGKPKQPVTIEDVVISKK